MQAIEKSILYTTLYAEYFIDILEGRKKNEWRKASERWIKLLEGKQYDEIHFTNGYGKHRPWMRVECKEIIRQNIVTLGGDTFAISLGKVISSGNLDKLNYNFKKKDVTKVIHGFYAGNRKVS